MMVKKNFKPRKCKFCGKVFTPRITTHIFCSTACRQHQWQKDNQEKIAQSRRAYEERCCEEAAKGDLSDRPNLARRQKKKIESVLAEQASVKQVIRDYKSKVGCQRCGYNAHYSALQFHHQPGFVKSFNVCQAKTIKQFNDEVKKCIVLCANCHALQNCQDMVERSSKKRRGRSPSQKT